MHSIHLLIQFWSVSPLSMMPPPPYTISALIAQAVYFVTKKQFHTSLCSIKKLNKSTSRFWAATWQMLCNPQYITTLLLEGGLLTMCHLISFPSCYCWHTTHVHNVSSPGVPVSALQGHLLAKKNSYPHCQETFLVWHDVLIKPGSWRKCTKCWDIFFFSSPMFSNTAEHSIDMRK